MRYKWLAQHLVRHRFPDINKKVQNEIANEAICRAWCTFLAPDYRLMQACVDAAAQRKGLFPPAVIQPSYSNSQDQPYPGTDMSQRTSVIHMSDYR